MEKKISLELGLNDVNYIMAVLAKQPYDTVVNLLADIKAQGQPQVQIEEEKVES